jgi:hypothetical protein
VMAHFARHAPRAADSVIGGFRLLGLFDFD